MRTSRVSKETASLLGGKSSLPPSPPRRTTRSSALSRFAYTGTGAASEPGPRRAAPDIEDGAPDAASSRRKRRKVSAKLELDDASRNVAVAVKTEEEKEEELDIPQAAPPPPPPSTTNSKQRRKPARVIKGASPTSPTVVEPPTDWERLYDHVRRMRLDPGGAARNAAVDTMGCDRLFDPSASDRDKRFHILVALMMSSQTKDTVNAVAMGRLHAELPPHKPGAPPGLTLENVLAVEPAALNELIRQVGFHNNKTKYIKQAAVILRDKHASDVPNTIQGLVSLPGVGPKMAHLCLSAAWDRTEGIGVDVHVHRLTNMWGWHSTSNPEATRLALESWLPRDKWRDINTLLVGLGQTVCPPQAGAKQCGDCALGLEGLCKGADRKKVAEGRKRREGEGAKLEQANAKGEVDVDVDVDVDVKEEIVGEDADGMAEVEAGEKVKMEDEDASGPEAVGLVEAQGSLKTEAVAEESRVSLDRESMSGGRSRRSLPRRSRGAPPADADADADAA